MSAVITELADVLTVTAEAVRPEQLEARTPCTDFTVGRLLDHLASFLARSQGAARKIPQPWPAGGSDPASVAAAARTVGAVWQTPGALVGTTDLGFGPVPADLAVLITVQELGLHGWDLAVATGSPYRLSKPAGQAVLEAVEGFAAGARASGSYGPPLHLSPNAPALQRALGTSGRSPSWAR
ncbi:TIGR03086 family metal-binding protein [Streptomyces sp. AD681]|uniref:TIGR03086 family protein n=1 Tax=Streptomyces rubrogriseus TaxID=194673 RepID=A0A6G3TU06_9ACTN|nr:MULTISPECIES: TIGR03086 family metal-binding protein [Streptomyces]MDA5142608.1 TIGR03086 family metal-binding protein [Streptomyces sp. AD681]MYS70415.1 TIGR03086 family protein [Streptomyces sp. SID5926]NEC39778.1 TIGR03086 family protein [Streptomyces rubrogriseus]